MGTIRKSLYIIISVIAVVVAIGSILSVFSNTESRFLKMLDFPRLQFFIFSVVSLVLLLILTKKWRWHDYLIAVGLLIGIGVQSSYLVYYTGLADYKVPEAEKGSYSEEEEIGILIVNVKMKNKESKDLLEIIKVNKPDFVLAMEVDDWWNKELESIERDYPYSGEIINEVTYGMALYSKYELEDFAINYLHNDKVPSFESRISLDNGSKFKLYTVHPVPPTHFEHLPDNEGKKEAEMVKVGSKVESQNLPAIIAGDINDVVWSDTDRLTGTEDLLYDVRVGRGFYNSYSANNLFIKWPLDHIFVTEEIRFVSIERLESIGSDHYPIYAKLVLN